MNVLYLEAHLILRGADPGLEACTRALQRLGWWFSALDAEDGPDDQERPGDLIGTTRGASDTLIRLRIQSGAKIAQQHGVEVVRYKIEAATLDSKHGDSLGCLGKEVMPT